MTHVLCWDIDGTLLTTARAGIFALEEAAVEVCGAEPDLAALRTAGLTDGQVAALVVEQCGGEATPDAVIALLRAYERRLPECLHRRQGRVMPGVQETLEEATARPDVHLLLLTGNTEAGAAAKLAHYGLAGYFDGGAFCRDGEPREEIAARAHALAAQRLGAAPGPGRFHVIGDTPYDIRCGQAVGARTVAVASGEYPVEALRDCGPDVVLESLEGGPGLDALLGP